MTTNSYTIDEDTRVELTFNRETITAHGYTYEDAQWDKDDEDHQPEGMYLTSANTYSGHTASECIILTLMDIGRVDEWHEGITMLQAAGIPYVPSED